MWNPFKKNPSSHEVESQPAEESPTVEAGLPPVENYHGVQLAKLESELIDLARTLGENDERVQRLARTLDRYHGLINDLKSAHAQGANEFQAHLDALKASCDEAKAKIELYKQEMWQMSVETSHEVSADASPASSDGERSAPGHAPAPEASAHPSNSTPSESAIAEVSDETVVVEKKRGILRTVGKEVLKTGIMSVSAIAGVDLVAEYIGFGMSRATKGKFGFGDRHQFDQYKSRAEAITEISKKVIESIRQKHGHAGQGEHGEQSHANHAEGVQAEVEETKIRLRTMIDQLGSKVGKKQKEAWLHKLEAMGAGHDAEQALHDKVKAMTEDFMNIKGEQAALAVKDLKKFSNFVLTATGLRFARGAVYGATALMEKVVKIQGQYKTEAATAHGGRIAYTLGELSRSAKATAKDLFFMGEGEGKKAKVVDFIRAAGVVGRAIGIGRSMGGGTQEHLNTILEHLHQSGTLKFVMHNFNDTLYQGTFHALGKASHEQVVPSHTEAPALPPAKAVPEVSYTTFRGNVTDKLILLSLNHFRDQIEKTHELKLTTAQDASTMAANIQKMLESHKFDGIAKIEGGKLVISKMDEFREKILKPAAEHAHSIHKDNIHAGAVELGHRKYDRFMKALGIDRVNTKGVVNVHEVHHATVTPEVKPAVLTDVGAASAVAAEANAPSGMGQTLDEVKSGWSNLVHDTEGGIDRLSAKAYAGKNFIVWAMEDNKDQMVNTMIPEEERLKLAQQWAADHDPRELGTADNHNAFNRWALRKTMGGIDMGERHAENDNAASATETAHTEKVAAVIPLRAVSAEHPIALEPVTAKNQVQIQVWDNVTHKAVKVSVNKGLVPEVTYEQNRGIQMKLSADASQTVPGKIELLPLGERGKRIPVFVTPSYNENGSLRNVYYRMKSSGLEEITNIPETLANAA